MNTYSPSLDACTHTFCSEKCTAIASGSNCKFPPHFFLSIIRDRPFCEARMTDCCFRDVPYVTKRATCPAAWSSSSWRCSALRGVIILAMVPPRSSAVQAGENLSTRRTVHVVSFCSVVCCWRLEPRGELATPYRVIAVCGRARLNWCLQEARRSSRGAISSVFFAASDVVAFFRARGDGRPCLIVTICFLFFAILAPRKNLYCSLGFFSCRPFTRPVWSMESRAWEAEMQNYYMQLHLELAAHWN